MQAIGDNVLLSVGCWMMLPSGNSRTSTERLSQTRQQRGIASVLLRSYITNASILGKFTTSGLCVEQPDTKVARVMAIAQSAFITEQNSGSQRLWPWQ